MTEYEIPSMEEYEHCRLMYTQGNITLDEFKRRMGLPTIDRAKLETDGMVDKWYEMDPETEDLLYDGAEIRPGMWILLENPEMRVDVREPLTDEELFRAHRTNRWGMVSRVDFTDRYVVLLLEYEDGVKSKVEIPVTESWIVKREKISLIGRAQVPNQQEQKKQEGPWMTETENQRFLENDRKTIS